VLAKGKQFLLLIRHSPCYSHIQSSPVKVFAVVVERGKRLKTILIVNFPFISRNILESSACGVCISHLVHYFKACVQYSDFLDTARLLIQKLLKQGYVAPRLNHRYTNFAVGFTISLTIAKYTYFKRDVKCKLHTLMILEYSY
jgi:hypothetical protein